MMPFKAMALRKTGSGGSGISARYWKLDITTNQAGGSQPMQIYELYWVLDTTDQSTAGATKTASSDFFGTKPPANAFDGAPTTTYWATDNTQVGWIKCDFGSAVTLNKLDIYYHAPAGNAGMPKDFTIQYSADNSSWTTAKTVTNQTSYNSNARTSFTW